MKINKDIQEVPRDEKICKIIDGLDEEKEKKLLNLLAEILVKITLKELYEKSD